MTGAFLAGMIVATAVCVGLIVLGERIEERREREG